MTKLSGIVVDDDPDIANLFKELLILRKIDVLGIGYNGTEAIELFNKKNPSIVFMDVHMPKLSGVEALKKIKEKSSDSKVIMVTGDTSEKIRRSLENYGADAIIYKPISMEKFDLIMEELTSTEITSQIN